MDNNKKPAIALGQRPEPLVQRTVIRKVLRGVFAYHAWPMDMSDRKKQQVLHEEMVEHTHLLVQLEAVKYRHNRVYLNTLNQLTLPKEEDKFSQKIIWSIKDQASHFSSTMELNRANMLQTPQLAVTFCSIIAAELMTGLKPSVKFATDTKEGDNTPYSINIPVKRENTLDRLQTMLEVRVEKHRWEILEELSTPVVKDHDYREKPKGNKFGYSSKVTRSKKKSFRAWLSGLFKRK